MIHHFGRVDLFVAELERALGEKLDIERGSRNHPARVAEQKRAVVLGFDRGDFLAVIENRLRETLENRQASFGTECGPLRIGATRRGDGRIDLVRAARAHVGEMLAVDRRAIRKFALRLDALAVDEMIGRDIYSRDFGSAHANLLPADSLSVISLNHKQLTIVNFD